MSDDKPIEQRERFRASTAAKYIQHLEEHGWPTDEEILTLVINSVSPFEVHVTFDQVGMQIHVKDEKGDRTWARPKHAMIAWVICYPKSFKNRLGFGDNWLHERLESLKEERGVRWNELFATYPSQDPKPVFNLVLVSDMAVLDKYATMLSMGKLVSLDDIRDEFIKQHSGADLEAMKVMREMHNFFCTRGNIEEDTTYYLQFSPERFRVMLFDQERSIRMTKIPFLPESSMFTTDNYAYLSEDKVILGRCKQGEWRKILSEQNIDVITPR